jgi:hypothetical protein
MERGTLVEVEGRTFRVVYVNRSSNSVKVVREGGFFSEFFRLEEFELGRLVSLSTRYESRGSR